MNTTIMDFAIPGHVASVSAKLATYSHAQARTNTYSPAHTHTHTHTIVLQVILSSDQSLWHRTTVTDKLMTFYVNN